MSAFNQLVDILQKRNITTDRGTVERLMGLTRMTVGELLSCFIQLNNIKRFDPNQCI